MSRKQTIIILHYKYTVSRRRDRVQAPAPTTAAGRVHYTRRGGITRPTYSTVLALLLPPVPAAYFHPSLFLSLIYHFIFTFFSRFTTRVNHFSLLPPFIYSTRSQNTAYSTLDNPVFLEGSFTLEY